MSKYAVHSGMLSPIFCSHHEPVAPVLRIGRPKSAAPSVSVVELTENGLQVSAQQSSESPVTPVVPDLSAAFIKLSWAVIATHAGKKRLPPFYT